MEEIHEQLHSKSLKIVLFGPESTGKTTLAKSLAMHFKTQWVPEYMREFLQEKWEVKTEKISKEDLIPIAVGQISAENEVSQKAKTYLFCDTNLLELKVYSQYYYDGFVPSAIENAISKQKYDYYFLTAIDVPWEKDDLRDRPYDRSALFCMFEDELKARKLPYSTLEGTQKERLIKAISILEDFQKIK